MGLFHRLFANGHSPTEDAQRSIIRARTTIYRKPLYSTISHRPAVDTCFGEHETVGVFPDLYVTMLLRVQCQSTGQALQYRHYVSKGRGWFTEVLGLCRPEYHRPIVTLR